MQLIKIMVFTIYLKSCIKLLLNWFLYKFSNLISFKKYIDIKIDY